MLIHTRSVAHKVFEIWRSSERFTKNPDVVRLPSGRLMLIYCDTDSHLRHRLTLVTGKSDFDAASKRRRGEHLVQAPRARPARYPKG